MCVGKPFYCKPYFTVVSVKLRQKKNPHELSNDLTHVQALLLIKIIIHCFCLSSQTNKKTILNSKKNVYKLCQVSFKNSSSDNHLVSFTDTFF